MTSDQITAFKSAVGGPAGGYLPGNFALLLALIGAAALLLWGTASKLFAYKVRVLVLIFLVVAILNA